MAVGCVEIDVEIEDLARLLGGMNNAVAVPRMGAQPQPAVTRWRNLYHPWITVKDDRAPVCRQGHVFDALYGAGCEIPDHRIPVERRRVSKTNLRTHNNQFYAVGWSDMSAQSPTVYGFTSTPIGKALLVGSNHALIGLHMADHAHTPAVAESWLPDRGQLDDVRRQLDEYLDRKST